MDPSDSERILYVGMADSRAWWALLKRHWWGVLPGTWLVNFVGSLLSGG